MSRIWVPRWQLLVSFVAFITLPPLLGTGSSTGSGSMRVSPLADPPPVRKDFLTLPNAAVDSFRKGVSEMMKLDVGKTDANLSQIGWKYQAYIHGTVPGTVLRPGWNTCQHSSWFFLSWHRMELYYFERIIRAMSGDPTLTLPYWNFGVAPAGKDATMFGSRIPAAFRVRPTVADPNALFFSHRETGVNKAPGPGAADTADPLDRDVVTTLKAFSQPAFFSNVEKNGLLTFGGGAIPFRMHAPRDVGRGQLEDVPHDAIHGAVGDGTPTSLTSVAGSGLDPIFWPFHANIDRAWSCWQQLHPGTTPKSDFWLKEKFTFYDVEVATDGTKTAVKRELTGEKILDTAAQLNYVYDNNCDGLDRPPAPKAEDLSTQVEQGALSAGPTLTVKVEAARQLVDKAVTLTMDLPSEVQTRIDTMAVVGAPPGSIILNVGGIAVDHDTAASYGVYLDLPEGETPSPRNEHYVGPLSFFGVGHHRPDDAHGGAMIPRETVAPFDITAVVRDLVTKEKWVRDQVTITFVNTRALHPGRASPPPAPAEANARFTNLVLTVE